MNEKDQKRPQVTAFVQLMVNFGIQSIAFEKGLDKIRKKTGEEAIELLLARDEKDLVYESADLIYHLLVMLEASGLSWPEVTGELTRRYGE